MALLERKTIFITGASRGIGRAMALRFARDGANVVIAAKTTEPHPKLEGTIFSVAAEVESAGGKALPIRLDIRDEVAVEAAAKLAAETFGGIDVLINNASAISLTDTQATPAKRFDLMHQVNTRGTYLGSRACIPFLGRAENPHILTLSPPLDLEPRWFKDHLAYSLSKFGMSMCTLGLAAEFADAGIAVNSLWPRTTIATAAVATFLPQMMAASRRPEIMADAAYAIITRPSRAQTGRFFIDEGVLRDGGVVDFEHYAMTLGAPLATDIFVD